MRPSPPFDPSDPTDPEPGDAPSRDAITPRGGFMARPGLKNPPRHAVVVRLGDAPATEDIPRVRSSAPPPPPSEVAPLSVSEQITLRNLATPPGPATLPPPSLPPVVESLPPPSDMPVVASVRASESRPPQPKRAARSRWTIVAAAAAGLVLGLASVATTRRGEGAAGAERPPAPQALVPPSRGPAQHVVRVPGSASAAPRAVSSATPEASQGARSLPASSPRPVPGQPRSIF